MTFHHTNVHMRTALCFLLTKTFYSKTVIVLFTMWRHNRFFDLQLFNWFLFRFVLWSRSHHLQYLVNAFRLIFWKIFQPMWTFSKTFFSKRKWDGDLITSCLPLKRILGIIKNVCNLPQFVKRLFCLFTLFYKLAEEYSSIIIFNRVVMST